VVWNRLTLLVSEDGANAPNEDMKDAPLPLPTQDACPPRLHLVSADEDPFPDDAA
jgi:hypothetical protein